MARWIDALLSYQFDVEHRPGRKHSNANAISRIQCKQCGRIENEISWLPVMIQMTEEMDILEKGSQMKKTFSLSELG